MYVSTTIHFKVIGCEEGCAEELWGLGAGEYEGG